MTKPTRPRMSIGPSEPPPPLDADARKEFVDSAKVRTSKPNASTAPAPLPWEVINTGPRSVQIRTTDKMALQLQYLKDQGHIRSFYAFGFEALEQAIEKRLKEEGVTGGK